jgi:alpha-N-arabinofuranosidase
MVNVLQTVILTEGPRMLKTPTYHVMHMYRHHQGAQLVRSELLEVPDIGTDAAQVPMLTESVSVSEDGVVNITLGNLSAEESADLQIQLQEDGYHVVEAKILRGEQIQSHNTFDEPDRVAEQTFAVGEDLCISIPAASVVALRLKK